MAKTWAVIIAFAAGLLALVGLTFSSSRDAPADFVFVNGTEPRSLDPHIVTGQPAIRIVEGVFEGLTRRDPKSLLPVPGVAQSWEISPDGRRYVFTLRDDALWSDGRPLTAHDFAYSWRRLQDPALGGEYAYLLHCVAGAEAFNTYGADADAIDAEVWPALSTLAGSAPRGLSAERWKRFRIEQRLAERVAGTPEPVLARFAVSEERDLRPEDLSELGAALARESARRRALHVEAATHYGVDAGAWALDARRFAVELNAPTPYFLELTAYVPTMPVRRDLVEGPHAKTWFLPEHIVSNGPYRLTQWRVNDRVRLERNERYWGRDAVRLARIDALPIENAMTSLNLFLTGEVDWLPQNYPRDLGPSLRKRSDFYAVPGLGVYYYRFNTRRKPFDDARVRRAFALAVDRDLITGEVLGLGELPARRFVPPGIAGYTPPAATLRYDPARARELLAEAGYPSGEGIGEVGILFNTHEGHRKIAELIADELRRSLGVEARAYNQEWQSYLATIRTGDYDLARSAWIGDYIDPTTFLEMWITGGGNNQTGWGNARYDALLSAAGDVEAWARAGDEALEGLRERAALAALRAAMLAEPEADARRVLAGRLRMGLLAEAEAILVQDELPVIPIYFYVMSGLVNPELRGFHTELELPDGTHAINLQDRHPLRDLWFDDSAGTPVGRGEVGVVGSDSGAGR